MNRRLLTTIQRLLVAAISIVFLVIVAVVFVKVLRPGESVNSSETTSSTTLAVQMEGTGIVSVVTSTTATTTGTTTPPTCEADRPEAASGTIAVRVYYNCLPTEYPTPGTWVERRVPQTNLRMTATLGEMVRGPSTDERDAGFRSAFSPATADGLREVTLRSGQAVVDISGLESFDGPDGEMASIEFMAELNATVFQFRSVSSVEYRLDGSCDAFWSMVAGASDSGRIEYRLVTRDQWDSQVRDFERLNRG